METILLSALEEALQRRADGWRWRDETPEPAARDMLLRDLAPNFRCIAGGNGLTYVEIPETWREARWWPSRRVDQDAASVIEELIKAVGDAATIYAEDIGEMIDNHRISRRGWRVPVSHWDIAMREPCGVWWDIADEARILARARDLGWTG